jgi:hypothetical protein
MHTGLISWGLDKEGGGGGGGGGYLGGWRLTAPRSRKARRRAEQSRAEQSRAEHCNLTLNALTRRESRWLGIDGEQGLRNRFAVGAVLKQAPEQWLLTEVV